MKKNVFTLLLALVAIATTAQAQVVLNETNFPDANFRAALAEILEINEGDEISAEKIAATTELNVSEKNISDLTGIEHFTTLTVLCCNDNQLTSLDVSKNTALKGLYCINNQLTSLDVSKNTLLIELYCHTNQLTSLNVSGCTSLLGLGCGVNQLTSLDVSKNTALEYLECYNNQLTSLDVSQNTALKRLECHDNRLTSLNVSGCTELSALYCHINQIKGKAMDALVASLPAEENGVVRVFYVIDTKDENERNVCTKAQVGIAKEKGWTVFDSNWRNYEGSDPNIKSVVLNAENFPDANFRVALAEKFGISEGDEITEAKIAATTSLNVSNKQIVDLTGIEHFTALTSLSCSDNQLTSLDVSQNTALKELGFYNNQLTSLDVSNSTVLERLYCNGNQLTTLNASGCTALTTLWCDGNKIKKEAMGAIVEGLPTVSNGKFYVVDTKNNKEGNFCTKEHVAAAKEKGWTAYDWNGSWVEYEGIDPNIKAVVLNAENFPDANFRAALASKLGISEGDEITEAKIGATTSLDVNGNYNAENEDITDLTGIEHFIVLTVLYCNYNRLTSLDVSNNTALKRLYCYRNQIKGEAMNALVNSLPPVANGWLIVIDTKNKEKNVCTKSQVAVAKEKGWMVYDYFGGGTFNQDQETWAYVYPEYEGSDSEEEDIDPVDEDDNIDFGSDMDENDDLNGNVIGDIFYNIGNGNGEYNAEEGCIVLKKTTDDETVDGLSGKDIFGEDFKGQFTGIVFKVPSGKGTVKVTAETTGNMLLKVKIGDGEPVEMELNGKLKISFPYNVSETTLVAIYASANNEAKGFGTTNATDDAALKIYGIEFERGETTAIDASLNNNGKMTNDSYYSIDGVKLKGEPTKKGIYIYKGKKVKK